MVQFKYLLYADELFDARFGQPEFRVHRVDGLAGQDQNIPCHCDPGGGGSGVDQRANSSRSYDDDDDDEFEFRTAIPIPNWRMRLVDSRASGLTIDSPSDPPTPGRMTQKILRITPQHPQPPIQLPAQLLLPHRP